jgi:transcriptional regulator with GAF, ATPase, and Fis domain
MTVGFMEEFKEFKLSVWREACRHIEINESAANIAEMLLARMHIDGLIICRIDKDQSLVETVVFGPSRIGARHPNHQTQWSINEIKRLLDWCLRGEVKLRKDEEGSNDIPFNVIPPSLRGDVLIGPLVSEHETFGLLLLVAKSFHRFTVEDERICQSLLEPFAVALENDHRLRELHTLREAAEADKRSLLARLGREDLSETIIGADQGLSSVMERVGLVARSDVPVLILGETGSGKEVVARAIHNRSQRAEGPFIRVNCGAIATGLIDSELFGHEKGSFTGATSTHRGWFERADEGTLLLDEIGELPQPAQVRLLRVLQDGLFERVGGEKSIKVDVRIIVATHRDLAAMVQDGEFREDLWYRIAVFPIVLPPLRERREDIAVLAEHFARRAAMRFGLRLQMPSPEDISRLASYHWPGNVREFSSVIDRAVILGNGERLEVAKALGVAADLATTTKPNNSSQESAEMNAATTTVSLDTVTRRHIEVALAATHGRIEGPYGAAVLLKINPHTLRARMRKLGINWSSYRLRR